MEYWSEYESSSMGGGNPYYACIGCGKTDPQINGQISNHGDGCTEVAKYHASMNQVDAEGTITHEDREYDYHIVTDYNTALIDLVQIVSSEEFYPLGERIVVFSNLKRASETLRDSVSLMIAKLILSDAGIPNKHDLWYLGQNNFLD